MPFFIRKPSKRKITNYSKNVNKFKNVVSTKTKTEKTINENEIESESENDDAQNSNESFSEDENVNLTVQEKKVKLAKKYLEELKTQKKEEFYTNDETNENILKKLKENELEKAGKLKKKIADNVKFKIENKIVLHCKQHKLSIICAIISSDNRYLYSCSKDCIIVKWSSCDMKRINFILPKSKKSRDLNSNNYNHDCIINCLAISYDDKYLISGDEKGVINVWKTEDLQHVHTFKGHKKSVTDLAACQKTNSLYSASEDALVKVWNLNELGYVETLFGHQSGITSVDILNKDRVITSGGSDKTIRVWKIQEESQLIYNGHLGNIDIVKRLDDDYFISGGDDGALCLWGSLKKKPLCIIDNAHGLCSQNSQPNWISALAVFLNSDLVASGSCDNNIRLWQWSSHKRIICSFAAIPVMGFVNSIQFMTNGSYVVAAIGKEHKLGRWQNIKEAYNSIVCIPMEIGIRNVS